MPMKDEKMKQRLPWLLQGISGRKISEQYYYHILRWLEQLPLCCSFYDHYECNSSQSGDCMSLCVYLTTSLMDGRAHGMVSVAGEAV